MAIVSTSGSVATAAYAASGPITIVSSISSSPLLATETVVTFSDTNTVQFQGTFNYNANGDLVGGTLNTVNIFSDSALSNQVTSITSIGSDPSLTVDQVEGGNLAGFISSILAGADSITGGVGNNVLQGFAGADTISGGVGSDNLFGNQGSDSIDGGEGTDTIYGGQEADSITGAAGADSLFGNLANDTIDGGAGDDSIYGGQGSDSITGGTENDLLFGNLLGDTLSGDAGNDSLFGGQGADSLNGGAGSDVLYGGLGNDSLMGGDGADGFYFASSGGLDIITDFAIGTDQLHIQGNINGSGITSFSGLTITNDGLGNSVISLGGSDAVTLNGILSTAITTSDVVFY